MTFRDGMDMLEAIALVEKAKAIEAKALSDRARLLAERDGWREIALELLKASMGEEAELFRKADGEYSFPPLELVEAVGREPRALLQQFWADTTRMHAERRTIYRRTPREAIGVVTSTLPGRAEVAHLEVAEGEDLQIGDPVFLDSEGRVRRQRGRW